MAVLNEEPEFEEVPANEEHDQDLYRLWHLQEAKHLKENELKDIDQEIAALNEVLGPGYEPSSPAYGPCDVFDYPAEEHETEEMPADN